ncbi:GNAT family N-acetyltransferase [Halobacillus salinus]|uniref:GNAT family N-acetyltransferase n=1 Tax=Halobacillus salinus TaxID=192814 RepID=UPI0009A659A0|nr:GNAT family N-acetyltransferase [Halobacillus salinus]
MEVIECRIQDISEQMLVQFERYQSTTKVIRNEGGLLREVEDAFTDQWTLAKKREIVSHFKAVIRDGGAVIVARNQTQVVGFAVIEAAEFGEKWRYRELSFLHVTSSERGNGVGVRLFEQVIESARRLQADKLYIGAHPAVETQKFYRKMGCVLAKEINKEIFEREKYDIQLEYQLD